MRRKRQHWQGKGRDRNCLRPERNNLYFELPVYLQMMRFTAYVSGRIQRVGYRARIVDLARKMGLSGLVQNRPDGQVLVIAEGEKQTLEKFAAALQIKNTFIEVKGISLEYSPGSGGFSDFRKITGPDEVGERLDDGIEILKEMVTSLNSLNGKMDQSLNKQDQMLGKQDQMLGKQDQMLGKQDQMLDKQDQMLDKQDQISTNRIRCSTNRMIP